MAAAGDDKSIERERYDQRAARALDVTGLASLPAEGARGIPASLRTPYLVYEEHVRRHVGPGVRVLDLCCGTGQHSMLPSRLGAAVTVCDLAPKNVELTLARARAAGLRLDGVVADAEHLPFADRSFDVVTVAGSISYVEFDPFFSGVLRVLQSGGALIFVDSLNHNPFYRFNRWRHYRRGELSRSILRRMPTLATMERIRRDLPDLTISFHGIFCFLCPVLRPWMSDERAARWLDTMDRSLPIAGRFAFKVVGLGHIR